MLSSFNTTNIILALVGPIIANYTMSSSSNIKDYLMFLMVMYIYTVVLILYKCRYTNKTIKEKATISWVPVIPWVVWSISLIIMSNMKNSVFTMASGLMSSVLGVILVALIFYLPSLQISSSCF